MSTNIEKVTFESTLKSTDTEEIIDIYFYRPIGFRIAKACAKIGITPNTVTWASIFIGIASGLLFYYQNIYLNIIGILTLMTANALDSADGQLARMTNNKSLFGRLLDGLAGAFWFISIHIGVSWRLMDQGWPWWIWLLGAASLLAHMIQAQQGDYYRNVYLYFIKGKAGSEQDNSEDLKRKVDSLTWSNNFGQKAMYTFYLGYTKRQEQLAPQLFKFLKEVRARYKDQLPQWLVNEFTTLNKPLMKYTNIVQFNTRAIALFVAVLIDRLWLYFLFDLIVLNALLIYMIVRQERISKHFNDKLKNVSDNTTVAA
jgi:hypothetical protein